MSHLSEFGYRVVGHRGNPADFPENSREGLVSVVTQQLAAVELDIQLSQDASCFIIHDDHTRRVGHNDVLVTQSHSSELAEVSVHEPVRFGERFFPSYLMPLREACELLSDFAGEVFLELKSESLLVRDPESYVSLVEQESRLLKNTRRFISFDFNIVQHAKMQGLPCGWVMRDYSEQNLVMAQQLMPDYLIINYRRLPDEHDVLWPGGWQWFLYDIVDGAEAYKWAQRGAHYIESWAPLHLQNYTSRDS